MCEEKRVDARGAPPVSSFNGTNNRETEHLKRRKDLRKLREVPGGNSVPTKPQFEKGFACETASATPETMRKAIAKAGA